jgi:hypothetical protein
VRTFKDGDTVPRTLTGELVSAIWGDHVNGTFVDVTTAPALTSPQPSPVQVTDIVAEKLTHHRAWEVNSRSMHGDACPGHTKTLEITFKEDPDLTLEETTSTRTFKEGAVVHLSVCKKTGKAPRVEEATYGNHESQETRDVTEIVQTKLDEGEEWEVTNAAMGGNPCPGHEGNTLKVVLWK